MSKHGDITQLYHGNNLFSSLAHESIKANKSKILSEVIAVVREAGEIGMTCDEIEERLELKHQTASARVTEAKSKSLIEWDGNYRNTRSGRRAAVYVIQAGE